MVKQINVFLENQFGRLAEVTENLRRNNIDIRALYIADTTDYGILRMILDKPDEAMKLLTDAGFTVSATSVIAIAIPDVPGTLDTSLALLTTNNISLEYLYAFVGRSSTDAVAVIRVDDSAQTVKLFEENNIKVLSSSEVYGI